MKGWTIEQKRDGELHITALKEDGSTVLWHEAEWQIDQDDADFILKALSNHDSLVAAIENALKTGEDVELIKALAKVRAA